ncbi:hypothetical protein S2091_4092 [Solimicrobium silvestre]|uniref:Uncharacterized protein n=1 Tax=Solimicrobium silvestre TaxID=2099400 RepID=A0A2S9GTZ0_9BURK|nr:hypothetical protein S2091_4092 [Solimicrobium silvestre]
MVEFHLMGCSMKIPNELKIPLIVFTLESAVVAGFIVIFTFILKLS